MNHASLFSGIGGFDLAAREEIGKQIIIYENRRTNNSIFSCEQEW